MASIPDAPKHTTVRPPIPVRKERPPSPPPSIYDSKAQAYYSVGGLLGEGGFARCYEVIDEQGNRFAAKVVHKPSLKSQKQRQKLVSEISIHKSLSHPCIVKFICVFEDDVNVYMILEICENKTFVDMIKKRKRLTDPEIRYYMYQLLDSIRYMHRHGVIHRDIKLGNLFLADRMQLKIGDFGLAAVIKHDGERKKTICGTPNYIAPEVLFNKEGHSFEVDIWSLGIVMRIRENNLEFPPSISISNDVRTIIKSLLNSNPEQRPSIDDVLEHPFFSAQPIMTEIPVSALFTPPVFDMTPQITSIDMATGSGLPVRGSLRAEADRRHPPSADIHLLRSEERLATTTSGLESSAASPNEIRYGEPARAFGAVRQAPYIPTISKNIPSSPSDPTLANAKSPVKSTGVAHLQTRSPIAQSQARAPQSSNHFQSIPSSPQRPVLEAPTKRSPSSTLQTQLVTEKASHTVHQSTDYAEKSSRSAGSSSSSTTPLSKSSPFRDASVKSSTALEELLQILTDGLANRENQNPRDMDRLASDVAQLEVEELSLGHPDMFITKWIDYSNKYGLGYQLRDGSVGVYFNDSTSIILASDSFHFEYLYSNRSSEKMVMHRDSWNQDSFPPDLNKKVTLLRHFKGYMQENLYRACSTNLENQPKIGSLDYLTKYLRTKNGVFFRLSNHTLQLNLFDHTKLIISGRGKIITYIDTNREMHTHTLDWFLSHGSSEVIERIAYVRGVIYQMLVKKSKRAVVSGKEQ
ncbi:hypothetical protein BASA60_004200 [Batrachochytrium salamandrivorans]|nr:hypothetical protein BASA60_004200 [Batrachochytrium salamandrivorans]